MKICDICKNNLPLDCFWKSKSNFDGYDNACKKCKSKISKKKYRDNNKDKVRASNKNYEQNNKDKIKAQKKEYRKNNKNRFAEKRKQNKQKKKDYDRKRYLENQQGFIEYQKNYYENNPNKKQKRLEYEYDYRIKNKEKISAKKREKYKNDNIYKLQRFVIRLLRKSILICSDEIKDKFFEIFGYSFNEFKNHIESLFEPWMNWQNWGPYKKSKWNDNDQQTWVWNIDHIIPQSKLKYSSINDENFKKCWGLENLRPYSAKKNVIEGARK